MRLRPIPWITACVLCAACAATPSPPPKGGAPAATGSGVPAVAAPASLASSAVSAAPSARLFVRPTALPPPEDGPLPKELMLGPVGDNEALVSLTNGGDAVVIDLATGCITEGWKLHAAQRPTREPKGDHDPNPGVAQAFDSPEHALQVGAPLRAEYRSWLVGHLAEAVRFAPGGSSPRAPQGIYGDASYSADHRTIVINVEKRAFVSRDGGETFEPVIREANPLDDRADEAWLRDGGYLLIADHTGHRRMLVRAPGGPPPGIPLDWEVAGPGIESEVGQVGTVLHLLPQPQLPPDRLTPSMKVCTKTVDLSAPTARAKPGVCFRLFEGERYATARSEKLPFSAFAEADPPSGATVSVTLVNLAKGTHVRHPLEGVGRYRAVHVDPTGQIAWTGVDGKNRMIGLDGKTRAIDVKGVVAGWAPPTSKYGVLLLDEKPRGGTLRDHRCSLLRPLPR